MRCLLRGAHDGQAFGWERIVKDANNSSICMRLSFHANGISLFGCLYLSVQSILIRSPRTLVKLFKHSKQIKNRNECFPSSLTFLCYAVFSQQFGVLLIIPHV